MLIVSEEVSTGLGRMSRMFGSELYRITPDLMGLGKGPSGGHLPMFAKVASGRVTEPFAGEDLGGRTFYHGHSFCGNALGVSEDLHHLALVKERDVQASVAAQPARSTGLMERLSDLDAVGSIRSGGVMAGVEMARAGDHGPGHPAADRAGRDQPSPGVPVGRPLRRGRGAPGRGPVGPVTGRGAPAAWSWSPGPPPRWARPGCPPPS